MSHPEKDELIFVYDYKFSTGVCGSPAGELKQFIHTPSIRLIDLDYYDKENGDFVYIDENFNIDEYLYTQERYGKVIKGMPSGLQNSIDNIIPNVNIANIVK